MLLSKVVFPLAVSGVALAATLPRVEGWNPTSSILQNVFKVDPLIEYKAAPVYASDLAGLSDKAAKLLFHELHSCGELLHGVANGTIHFEFPANFTRDDLVVALAAAVEKVEEWEKQHPIESDIIKTALTTVAVIVFVPEATLILLDIVGFGSEGIVIKSIASLLQSALYKGYISPRSIFAWLTSAAMRGYALRELRWIVGTFWVVADLLWSFAKMLKNEAECFARGDMPGCIHI